MYIVQPSLWVCVNQWILYLPEITDLFSVTVDDAKTVLLDNLLVLLLLRFLLLLVAGNRGSIHSFKCCCWIWL